MKESITSQALDCVNIYYSAIGQKHIRKSRLWRDTIPRTAIGVALARRVGDVVTGQILGKDRTTVIHYRKKHESNMRYWATYPEYFETASHIVESYLGEMAKAARLEAIDRKINQLVKQKTLIQSI